MTWEDVLHSRAVAAGILGAILGLVVWLNTRDVNRHIRAMRAESDAWRTMTGWCIAYREDGRVCRAPATIVDRQRGGLVCAAHAPAAATEHERGRPA